MLVPKKTRVVILTNAEQGGAFDAILYHILDTISPLPATDWIAAFKAVSDEEEKNASQSMADSDSAAPRQAPAPIERICRRLTTMLVRPRTFASKKTNLVFTLDHTPKAIADLQPCNTTLQSHSADAPSKMPS